MKFIYAILLKKSPWYIYSVSEPDVMETLKKFPTDSIVGVVKAVDGLEVLVPQMKLSLHPLETKFLQHVELADPVDEDALKEVMKEDRDVAKVNE